MREERNVENTERVAEAVGERPVVAPPVDIYENQDELLLVADVPGVKAEGLNVRLEKDVLVLEAKREVQESGGVVALGYRPADYARTFLVPRGIDGGKIEASLSNGVLRVRLPKSESVKPRRIEVKAS